jgi:hypothetical protein
MNKSTRNLLIVFVILIAVVYIFFKGKDKINTQNVQEKLFVADSSKIDKIEIVKTGESITLEKVNGVWQVSKPVVYPADTLAVTPILGNLQNFKIESITSTNPEKFNNYLDTVNNTQVTVYQEGKNLGTFILGKYALSYMNSYVKKPDENKILLATNLNQSLFVKPLKDFRNKIIFQLPTITLNKIDFKSTDSNHVNFEAVKDSAGRWFIGSDSIPQANIDGFLNMMANFTTEDFIDSVITTFPEPTYTVNLYGGPQPETINVYKMDTTSPGSFVVQVSNIKQLFKFSEPMARSLMKLRKDFIPEPPKEEKKDKKK